MAINLLRFKFLIFIATYSTTRVLSCPPGEEQYARNPGYLHIVSIYCIAPGTMPPTYYASGIFTGMGDRGRRFVEQVLTTNTHGIAGVCHTLCKQQSLNLFISPIESVSGRARRGTDRQTHRGSVIGNGSRDTRAAWLTVSLPPCHWRGPAPRNDE